eukprot:13386759-Alexandrium_andersonii.AAC.1
MPVLSTGLTRAPCRAHLDPLGLHSHTCPGQTRWRHDAVERALQKELSHFGASVDKQPAGISYRHVPDLQIVSPVRPGAVYAECLVPRIRAPANRATWDLDNGPAALPQGLREEA